MQKYIVAMLFAVIVIACGSQQRRGVSAQMNVVEPVRYGFKVKAEYPHSRESYTQGLQYVDGIMWEGAGEYGHSEINSYALGGAPKSITKLPKSEFGEGITVLGDKLYQLTWESNVCHVYNVATGKKLKDFRYPGEGWGLTSDGVSLYMSNGSTNIYKVNPETFRREGSITVTMRGQVVNFINELEWIDGKIWANVYTTDYIVIIDPQTGVVEGLIDFKGLLKAEDTFNDTDVLNGIAYDAEQKRIFVTGKRWNKIYEIEIVKR